MANKWYEVGQSKRIRCFFIVRVVSFPLKVGTFNFSPLEWGDHVIHFFSKDWKATLGSKWLWIIGFTYNHLNCREHLPIPKKHRAWPNSELNSHIWRWWSEILAITLESNAIFNKIISKVHAQVSHCSLHDGLIKIYTQQKQSSWRREKWQIANKILDGGRSGARHCTLPKDLQSSL
jgi:hypothetical protein